MQMGPSVGSKNRLIVLGWLKVLTLQGGMPHIYPLPIPAAWFSHRNIQHRDHDPESNPDPVTGAPENPI